MVGRQTAHTPYDGSAKPFTIGLKPLDLSTWLEIDAQFDAYIAEKKRLYATIPEKVFVEQPDTREAQGEVLDLIRKHLAQSDDGPPSDTEVAGDDPDQTPLKGASLLVQEDLILMRRGPDGWRLAAGSLCFPSSWSLAEKFGRPLQEIHAPVPGFGAGTRTADLIHRMFDNLKPAQPVERLNWSIQAGQNLYHPLSDRERNRRAAERTSQLTGNEILGRTFIRVERQTLRKLPASGDILFTIRIYLDPLDLLARHADRERLATAFAAQLNALDSAQLDYKGLTADRDRLAGLLDAMARIS